MKKIGIIGAMEIEVEDLIAELTPSTVKKEIKITAAGNLIFYEGKLGDIDVVITRSGVGKVNAALCAQRLIIQFGVTHIINTGIAGSLAKGLKVFDVVVSTDALYHDMDVSVFGYKPTQIPQMTISDFPADKELVSLVKKVWKNLKNDDGQKMLFGRVASGDQFISSKEQKSLIETNCKPMCVEMEGAGVAHACFLNNIPFVIIRTISDNSDDSEYSFNEKIAAKKSSALLTEIIKNIKA